MKVSCIYCLYLYALHARFGASFFLTDHNERTLQADGQQISYYFVHSYKRGYRGVHRVWYLEKCMGNDGYLLVFCSGVRSLVYFFDFLTFWEKFPFL
ncbi:hypothetical protein BCR43DRAFT_158172 [Syncephalastrum racemosum]|uniref:Uncharacterized protein n=1 Tax=Syncephalastrum racemosum TaxID=13706 RepID=A0A1X2HNI8_SYNRA|nr:hypothetical protein BCR43DRAFT_158172 [Syncephalastrum racemosum]